MASCGGVGYIGLGGSRLGAPLRPRMNWWLPIDGCSRRCVRVALLLLCAVMGFAAHGKAFPSTQATGALSTQPTSPFAIADFDGDSRPDLATVQVGQINASRARYWIRLQMSTGSRQSIGVTAPIGGLQIVSRDVNGDNALDLVLTTAWLNRPVAILLNDGHGNFTLRDAAAFPASIWEAERSLARATVQIKDAAVVLTRSLSGDCRQKYSAFSAPDLTGRLFLWVSPDRAFSSVASVRGRAPPDAVLHV
jgi:hypothetical protein